MSAARITGKAVLLAATGLCALLVCGCTHVAPGGASEVRASFGVPGVFRVEKNIEGIKVTEKTMKATSSDTTVNILLFEWKSSAKDLVLSNPPPEKP